MEIAAAALTGVACALFLRHIMAAHDARQRDEAGELLGKLAVVGSRWGRILLWLAAALLTVGFAWFLVRVNTCHLDRIIVYANDGQHLISSVVGAKQLASLGPIVAFVYGFSVSLFLVVPRLFRRKLEFRKAGLFVSNGPIGLFVPWVNVRYCQLHARGNAVVAVAADWRIKVREVGARDGEICEILRRHVELRDADGRVLNPDREPIAGTTRDADSLSRGPFQFSLKTLLLLVLVASTAFGWLSVYLQHGGRENRALANLDMFVASSLIENGHIVVLQVRSPDILTYGPTDRELRHLATLTRLKDLTINSYSVSDAGLMNVANLHQLVTLRLHCPEITDAGLKHLESLQQLEVLSVNCPKVTSKGLERLRKALPNTKVYGPGE